MVDETRVVELFDEAGQRVGAWFPYAACVVLAGNGYVRDNFVDVELCEQVDGDHCKCSNCQTVINFRKDDFCRGCGAEVYA